MEYIYIDNKSDKTLVLFHGTGGDEKVLLPIAKQVAPNMNHLSLRGDVVSFGKRRFSKVRFEDDLVDEEDLFNRIPNLYETVLKLRDKYDLGELWGLGFSNGAMTLSAMILSDYNPFKKAVLLRPLNCESETNTPPLKGMPILIHSGKHDPITPAISAVQLEMRLIKAGAKVEHHVYPLDHRMKMNEVNDIKKWFEKEMKE